MRYAMTGQCGLIPETTLCHGASYHQFQNPAKCDGLLQPPGLAALLRRYLLQRGEGFAVLYPQHHETALHSAATECSIAGAIPDPGSV